MLNLYKASNITSISLYNKTTIIILEALIAYQYSFKVKVSVLL